MKITKSIKVLIVGFGPLGLNLAKRLIDDPRFKLSAIVDNDEAKQGQEFNGVKIQTDLKKVLANNTFDLAFLVTSSYIEKIQDSLNLLIANHINVISSCEEFIFPSKEISNQLDQEARKASVRLLGTGINPGFLMDYLIMVMAKPFLRLNKIFYQRNINTQERRSSFKNKVGVGLSLEEFESKKKQGLIGHVGFKQSADMIAHRFSWTEKFFEESIEPALKDSIVQGIQQEALAKYHDGRSIEYIFHAQDGLKDSDKIVLSFETLEVPLMIDIPTGINGEGATVAMLMNSAPKLLSLEPGFKTMLDL
jgi:hypothetical protein